MYTLQNTARLLGVSINTVRRWINQDNINTELIETDRKRVYIGYNDLIALADKHRPLKVPTMEEGESSQELTGLYSTADVARLLGAKIGTVKYWLADPDIEKKLIVTDRKRSYISYTGLVTLADKHNRTIAYDKVRAEQNSDAQEDSHSQEENSYTVADAALFLGVTEDTVRGWLPLYNIEKKIVGRHIYISYSDLLILESKQKHTATHAASMTNNIREIRYRLEQIEAGILKLEKYIKRSIYVGP